MKTGLVIVVVIAGCSQEFVNTADLGIDTKAEEHGIDQQVPDHRVDTKPTPDTKPDLTKVDTKPAADTKPATDQPKPAPDTKPATDQPKPDLVKSDVLTPDVIKPDTMPLVPGTWVTVPNTSTMIMQAFSMGSPSNEPCRSSNEQIHLVKLSRAFEIMTTEVTKDQFKAVMGYDPSKINGCGGNCPVENVSWDDAVAYANALSYRNGVPKCYSCSLVGGKSVMCKKDINFSKIYDCAGYRLPTEAEWEYAYRGGPILSTTPPAFYNGPISNCLIDNILDTICWYSGNMGSGLKIHPVGQKYPNALSLYDMAGNVREWVHDVYVEDLGINTALDPVNDGGVASRIIRGGGGDEPSAKQRAALRRVSGSLPNGFRVVRSK